MRKILFTILSYIFDLWGLFWTVLAFIGYIIFVSGFVLGSELYNLIKRKK